MFTVEERADGTVGLAEAYTADGEPRVLNLILDTTVALLGATAAGFHGLERTEDRAFRWTTGEARIDVPIDRERRLPHSTWTATGSTVLARQRKLRADCRAVPTVPPPAAVPPDNKT